MFKEAVRNFLHRWRTICLGIKVSLGKFSPEWREINQPTMKRILTEMRKSKTRVQNLPYMYRCPSI